MATTTTGFLVDSLGQDILTPIVHHSFGDKSSFLEHVDLGAIIHDNIEHRVHTTIHDQLLKGFDGESTVLSASGSPAILNKGSVVAEESPRQHLS
jgi:hypothetical protein